jgi:hypothetical protein
MSNRKPVARLVFKTRDKQSFSILSIWRTDKGHGYSINRDKGSEKYPAIGLFEALKRWGQGDGYLTFWIDDDDQKRSESSQSRDDFGGGQADDFGDGGVPF